MKFAPKKKHATVGGTASTASTSDIKDHSTSSADPAGAADPVAEAKTEEIPVVIPVSSSKRPLRTKAYALAAVVLSFGAGVAFRSGTGDFGVAASANAPGVLAASSTDAVDAARDAALVYHGEFATFRGFTSPGVQVASSDTVLLLAAVVDGVCSFTKIVDGVVYETGNDPTLETCNPATLESAQAMLDEYRVAAAQAATAEHGSIVEAAANAAVLWASLSFDAYGKPSLYGLQDLQVPGTKVLSVASDGQSANVQVLSNGACLVAVLSARPGVLPQTSGC
jgi:hypothetical protein